MNTRCFVGHSDICRGVFFIRLDITENNIMCNKCNNLVGPVLPATPMLRFWANLRTKTSDLDILGLHIRDIMRNQMSPQNRHLWHHSRNSWVNSDHPINQKQGHELAKHKAIAHKTATREATTLQDMEDTYAYLKLFEYHNGRVTTKVEPAYINALRKIRDGEWEPLDIMNKLHPYLHDPLNSTQEGYARSQMGFTMMNRLHLVHLSTDDINQIAYYPTLKHMREGREVRTRLGRYLTKYQHALSLTDSDVKNMAEKHSANMRSRGGWSVDFVAHDDEKGWLHVYSSNDVGSCMRGMDAVRVYAHEKSVLRLAYVKAGDKIIARCIVRDDEHKGWLRVYPDPNGYAEGRYLLDYLKTNGYDKHTNLDGVLLQRIEDGGGLVCPYLDCGDNGNQAVDVVVRDGRFYLQAGGDEFEATNTSGYVTNDMCDCDDCGDSVHDDDRTYIEFTGNHVCESCRDDNYTYAYGARYQDYYPEDRCIRVGDDYYFEEYLSNHDIYQCEHDGEYYHIDDLLHTVDGTYHESYVVSIDHEDDDGNEYAYKDNVHTLSDGTTCHVDNAEHYQEKINEEETEEA